MDIVATLPNLNLSLTKIFQANAGLVCKVGEAPSDIAWATAAPDVKNANSFLVDRSGVTSDIIIRAGSILYTGTLALTLGGDNTISSAIVPPGGSRSSGTNFFYSESANFGGETLVILANKFNHIYPISEGGALFGVIATDSVAAPDSFVSSDITGDPGQTAAENPRQAVCQVDALGEVVSLVTFPRMVSDFASQPPSSGPAFIDWKKVAVAFDHNALTTTFEFLAGTGTGTVGEVGVFAGPELVAYKAISPQILKDSDIDLTVIWNMVIGAPEVFI